MILPADTPSTLGVGSKGQNIFLKVVMLHIKLKGIEHRAPLKRIKRIFCPYTPSTPWVGSKGLIFFFAVSGHVAYQKLKGKKWRPTCKQKL